jgi:hypothetical protein
MTTHDHSPVVLVPLHETTLALLMALRRTEGETLDSVAARCATAAGKSLAPARAEAPERTERSPAASVTPPAKSGATRAANEKRVAEMFGEPIGAPTWGMLLAAILDTIHDLDPKAVELFAREKAKTRRYVARDPKELYGKRDGRPPLPALQTQSGWWVIANIGEIDLRRGLVAFCRATGLRYGSDIRLVR